MLENRKKASVFLQGWFVFMLFLVFYNHYQTQIWWRNKAAIEFSHAEKTILQHIDVIESLRNGLSDCNATLEECRLQRFETKSFRYEVEFDLQSYHVIEINIINH